MHTGRINTHQKHTCGESVAATLATATLVVSCWGEELWSASWDRFWAGRGSLAMLMVTVGHRFSFDWLDKSLRSWEFHYAHWRVECCVQLDIGYWKIERHLMRLIMA